MIAKARGIENWEDRGMLLLRASKALSPVALAQLAWLLNREDPTATGAELRECLSPGTSKSAQRRGGVELRGSGFVVYYQDLDRVWRYTARDLVNRPEKPEFEMIKEHGE